MENLRLEQKQEAIERMKMLDIYAQAIKDFEKEDVINVSEHGGILFWLDDEQQAMVKNFEEKYNATVYHVIHNYTEFGELYSLLYVSQHKEEWDYDKDDIRHHCAFVYVVNKDEESFSEFGSIGIKSQFGGLVRTC